MKKLQVIFVILFAIIGIMVISTSSFAISEEEIVVEREDVKHTHTTEQIPPQQQQQQQQQQQEKKLADLQVPQPPLSRFGDEFDDFFNMKEDVADLITLAATGRLPQSPQRPMNLFSRIVDRYHNTIDKLMNKLRTTTHYDLDLPHWLPHTPSTATTADKNAMAPSSSSSIASWISRDFTPHVDVSETETQIRIHADLPGLKKEEIHVEVRPALGNREKLIIHGERRSSNIVTMPTTEETATTTTDQEKKQPTTTTATTTPNIKYRSVERSFGSFTREFLLPMGTQRKGIAAKYENGVLDVTVEKPTQLPAAEKPFSIDIM